MFIVTSIYTVKVFSLNFSKSSRLPNCSALHCSALHCSAVQSFLFLTSAVFQPGPIYQSTQINSQFHKDKWSDHFPPLTETQKLFLNYLTLAAVLDVAWNNAWVHQHWIERQTRSAWFAAEDAEKMSWNCRKEINFGWSRWHWTIPVLL